MPVLAFGVYGWAHVSLAFCPTCFVEFVVGFHMTDFEIGRSSHFLAVMGGVLLVAGMIQAAPHLLMSYQVGLSLCGAGAGGGQIAAMMLQTGGHCSGCWVALLGAALLTGPHFVPEAAKRLAFT